MKRLTFPFVLLLLVGIVPGAWTGAYEDKAAVIQTLNDYANAFSTFDVQSTVSYYHEPIVFITEKGMVVKATRTEAASRLTPLWEDLKAGGYARSKYTELHVKQLSPSIALVGIVAVRYKANGQELNRTGGYVDDLTAAARMLQGFGAGFQGQMLPPSFYNQPTRIRVIILRFDGATGMLKSWSLRE